MTASVYLYARVSTQRQAERDLSIPDQIQAMTKYAETEGWTITGVFIDAGVSGGTDRRREFQKMISSAKAGDPPVNQIMVHSYSRLFRNSFLAEKYRIEMEEHDVRFLSLTENFGDGDSSDSMRQLFMVFAEWQNKENAKHVTRTRKANALQGNHNGGITPYGYLAAEVATAGDRVRKRLEPNPDEVPIVRKIFELRNVGDGETGPLGIVSIAGWLNDHGYRARNGKPFYTSLVHRVLTGEMYVGRHWTNRKIRKTGKLRPKADWICIPVEPIISEELFAQTQLLLASCKPDIKAPRTTTSNVLLGGLARCGTCGGALMIQTGTGRSGQVFRYYGCGRKVRMGLA